MFGINRKNQNKQPLPKTAQQSIPVCHFYENGVIETTPGTFTRAYSMGNTDFSTDSIEGQARTFEAYGKLLNSIPDNCSFQILVQNRLADKRKMLDDIKFRPQRDSLNNYRQILNKMLIKKLSSGRTNLTQEKYLIVSTTDSNTQHAMQILTDMDSQIEDSIRLITGTEKTSPLTLEERLKSLHAIYNQDNESTLENSIDKDGKRYFSIKQCYKQGMTIRDAIAPSSLSFSSNRFQTGNTVGKAFFLDKYPSRLSTDFIKDLSSLPFEMLISIHYNSYDTSKATKMIRSKLTSINGKIAQEQKNAAQEGYSAGVIPIDLYRQKEHFEDLLEEMMDDDQKLFSVSFTLSVFGENDTILNEARLAVNSIAARYNVSLKTFTWMQENAFNSTLPLCVDSVSGLIDKALTTDAASIFIPYTTRELHHKNGLYYGLNEVTKSVIMYSRLSNKNYNGLIFGQSGSGKSMIAKHEMLNAILRSDKNRIYVIDPEGEYTNMCKALGGQVFTLSSGGVNSSLINPMDMDISYAGDEDPLAMKSDYIISLVEIMMGKGGEVSAKQKSIIDRCLTKIYSGYLEHIQKLNTSGRNITCDKEAMPTLWNLYNALKEQPEEDAHYLASVMEIYASGNLNTFSHRSDCNSDAQMVVYNIQKLGTGMKELGLHVCINDIWNKIIENRKKGLWSWFYIDEMHLLLRSESASRFLVEIWKRARKWNGIPTGIMQNTQDLMRSVDTKNILNNTNFTIMMDLAQEDRENLMEELQLSESQMRYVTQANSGHGLIYTGSTAIPFNNEMSKNNKLYGLMSTSATRDEENRNIQFSA